MVYAWLPQLISTNMMVAFIIDNKDKHGKNVSQGPVCKKKP